MESCCECATKKLCWRWRRHSLRYNYAPWVDYTGWNISSHYRPTAKQVLRAELTQSVMNAVHGLKAVITVREITIVSNVPSDKLCGMASGYVQWIDAFVVHLCPDKLFITTVTNILDQKLSVLLKIILARSCSLLERLLDVSFCDSTDIASVWFNGRRI